MIIYRSSLMLVAKAVATESPDTSTKVGAVLSSRRGFAFAIGFNCFPNGVRNLDERRERPAKYAWTVHAEMNALAQCAALGFSTQGMICYSTQIPCSRCMGILIQAGIAGVFCPTPDFKNMRQPWFDDSVITVQMCKEADVLLRYED